MDNKRPTVTIGIPVYNEERNVRRLLEEIRMQKQEYILLSRILVYSDGSTDNTIQLVREASIRDPRIRLLEGTARKGLAHGLNTLSQHASSDILLLLNADITFTDPSFLDTLSKPVGYGRADITTASMVPLESRTFVEHVLSRSVAWKEKVFRAWQHGQHAWTFYGVARALSKNVYEILRYPTSAGDDLYTYLWAHENGYRTETIYTTHVLYRLPATLHDHLLQSKRFFRAQKYVARRFPEAKEHLRMPRVFLRHLFFSALREPIEGFVYALLLGSAWLATRLPSQQEEKEAWDIATSSKTLHI